MKKRYKVFLPKSLRWFMLPIFAFIWVMVTIAAFVTPGGEEGLGAWIPGADAWVPITHGYLYLAYVVVAVDLWFRTRLPLLPMVGVVLAGTVPFMSFVAERWVTRRLTATSAPEPRVRSRS